MGKRDLLNFEGLSRREFDGILALAGALKRKQKRGIAHRLLAGKSLAMLFEKPSLRTRATFQAGMNQLGGHVIFLGPAEVGLGTREAPADCARSLARWVDLITVRTFAQQTQPSWRLHWPPPRLLVLGTCTMSGSASQLGTLPVRNTSTPCGGGGGSEWVVRNRR